METLTWDLSALFSDDDACREYTGALREKSTSYNKEYAKKLASLDIDELSSALMAYEELLEGLYGVMTYAFLRFSADTTLHALYAEFELLCTDIEGDLLFFELELVKREDLATLKKSLPKYAHYIEQLEANSSHRLGIKEEAALLAFSPTGVSAFARLFDESFSSMKFDNVKASLELYEAGVDFKKKIGEEEILSYLHDGNRELRKAASKEFTKKLEKNSLLLTYILNIVRKDLDITAKVRHYAYKDEFRHIQNDTTRTSVHNMIDVVNANTNIVKNYYAIKSRLLGHSLKDYDRYAPLYEEASVSIEYKDALKIVLDTFKGFHPSFYEIARRASQSGWVDVEAREHKRGGAFSHSAVPRAHPYVLLNFTGTRRDIFTIAHEFGHMVHQELAKGVGLLNCDTPLTTAETASVFAEMLTFEYMEKTMGKEELLPLYASKLEDIFSTMHRQIVMTNFELRVHDMEGELEESDYNKIWLEENHKMFGKSVKLTKRYALWWSYIPHFIHTPFYCYAYSYGQLLVLALYGLYKSGKIADFKERYIEFLSSGGSKSPRELVLRFGFDVDEKEFWRYGIREVEKMYNKFKRMCDDAK